MTITGSQFDTVQNALNLAQDEIERLKLRVAALEAGKPLPPDQVIAVAVSPHYDPPAPEPESNADSIRSYMAATAPAPEVAIPELDLSVGLTTGPVRK